MSLITTVTFSAIAALTIFIGLVLTRFRSQTRAWQIRLNSLAIGILVYLLWDMLQTGANPIREAMADPARTNDTRYILGLVALFCIGFSVGLVGLVFFDRRFNPQEVPAGQPDIRRTQTYNRIPSQIALMIAIGLGLNNFAQGLAIGQASGSGALDLATVLIIGFMLQNTAQGFSMAIPLTGEKMPAWRLLATLGVIAGTPAIVGSTIGFSFYSPQLFVLCLSIAAGAILFVLMTLLNIGRRFDQRNVAIWGIVVGFLVAFLSSLVLLWARS